MLRMVAHAGGHPAALPQEVRRRPDIFSAIGRYASVVLLFYLLVGIPCPAPCNSYYSFYVLFPFSCFYCLLSCPYKLLY